MNKFLLYGLKISAILFCFSGCVSSARYNKLALEHSELKQRYKALSTTPDYYFNEGEYAMKEGQYGEALEYFNALVSKFPASALAEEADNNIEYIRNISIKKFDEIREQVKNMTLPEKIDYIRNAFEAFYIDKPERDNLELILNELQAQYEKERYIVINENPLQSCRFIESQRNWITEYDDKKFSVELYIVENYEKEKIFRILTEYSGQKWIFYEKVILSGLNNSRLEIFCPVIDKKTSAKNSILSESHDYSAENDSSAILELAESDKIYVTFSGKEKFSFVMSGEALKAFKEMAAKF